MRQILSKKISTVASYLEILLSAIVLIGIAIMSAQLIKDIIFIISSISDISMTIPFEVFMGDALKLIIGIEFVKMLVRYTPESVVEVLLFAMARKLIVGNSTSLDIVIGIGGIAVLFVIRRFLFHKNEREVVPPFEDTTH
jgi:uncharacterized membrane protein (DUF373 family)